MPIPFIDLQAQRRRLDTRVDAAITRVLDHGRFIMGPEVTELEEHLASRCRVRHVVTCSSGTDALVLSLMALDVGQGDAVLCPAFTFAATAEAVRLVGATPVFVDSLPDTFNIDAAGVTAAVDVAERSGLRPRAVIAVDLFGQPADYDGIRSKATDHGLTLIADAAQSLGGSWSGEPVGSLAAITTTSFFPAKPLGCYGDGGAVATDDDDVAARVRSLRVHGQGADKYDNVLVGMNARLDTMQAAILLQKLTIFDEELEARDRVAARYTAALDGVIETPTVDKAARSVWAQYTVSVAARDAVAASLRSDGVPTIVYYRVPLHLQPAYASAPRATSELKVAEYLSEVVLSLPMHPYLDMATQDRIVEAVRRAVDAEPN